MNRALICIGSNDNREENVAACKSFMEKIFSNILYSDTSITIPYGSSYKWDFLNQLAVFKTDKDKEEVIRSLKKIEVKMGRKPEDKKSGLVKIDIDLLCWNEEVLKPEDMQRKYVTELLPTISL